MSYRTSTPRALATQDEDPAATGPRLALDVHVRPGEGSSLLADVRAGLARRPYRLPPKHFYDARGSQLFDAICDTPEYYPTRTETALLTRDAAAILERAHPTDLVELGSGSARKTRLLLDPLVRRAPNARYMPFDVSESALVSSARALIASYPTLRVHGVVGDYERHLARIPRGARRMVAFLGSTIGNFEPDAAREFLGAIARALHPGDTFLLGMDLVKDKAVLERAYNDAAGVTADFNRNVLAVINRELGGTFDLADFEHVAFYREDRAQIEMHLRARRAHTARVAALDLEVLLEAGEMIHTEISRKFTRASATAMLRSAGFVLEGWYAWDDPGFALALARAER